MNQQIGYDLVAHSALNSMNYLFLMHTFNPDYFTEGDPVGEHVKEELQNFILALESTLEEGAMTHHQEQEIRDSFRENLTLDEDGTNPYAAYHDALSRIHIDAADAPRVLAFYTTLGDEEI